MVSPVEFLDMMNYENLLAIRIDFPEERGVALFTETKFCRSTGPPLAFVPLLFKALSVEQCIPVSHPS